MSNFKGVWEYIKDVLFPKYCLACKREGEWLCEKCLEKLRSEVRPQFFCPVCYLDKPDGRVCIGCASKSYLDGSSSSADYSTELIADMIQKLKYEYIEELAGVFGKLAVIPNLIGNPVDYVVLPVPLHRRRYVERGFNQAELLAREWGRVLNMPVRTDVLLRARHTAHQVGLGREERKNNLTNAFAVKGILPAKRVILVDDVFTTGSTLQECARVLKSAGAEEVWGMTVARER
jgi:ComF family protein